MTYSDRVEARRAWETQRITSALFACAAALAIVDIGMAIFVAVYLGGIK